MHVGSGGEGTLDDVTLVFDTRWFLCIGKSCVHESTFDFCFVHIMCILMFVSLEIKG